jgi:hypothetical protein
MKRMLKCENLWDIVHAQINLSIFPTIIGGVQAME